VGQGLVAGCAKVCAPGPDGPVAEQLRVLIESFSSL
jgi:hypothetical protein